MAEYRALRERYSMLEMIFSAELSAQVTLQPINAFDLDAAIIFADILPPLMGMGLSLDFAPVKGPVIHNPLTTTHAIDLLGTPPAEESLAPTLEAIKIVAAELKPRGIPLIGFAGAPFTLASYAIEGGGSKDYARTKAMMYAEPAAWKRLMEKLVTVQVDYLLKQAQAGADALQIFDSWAGIALGKEAFCRFVAPYTRELLAQLASSGVPLIHFSTGTFPYLEDVAACGGEVVGVDFRMPLGAAWQKIGINRAIQGNLDPIALLADWRELKYQVDGVLAEAGGRPGHIFNVGHGLHQSTPVENVRRLVDYVHERTQSA